jgi:hypothetical protein
MRSPTAAGAAFLMLAALSACNDVATPLGPSLLTPPDTARLLTATSLTVSGLTVASDRAYTVVSSGLVVGAQQYVDRTYTLSAVPSALAGATFIRTANDDKDAAPGSASFLSFDVNADVEVFVALDPRLTPPAWMQTGWTDTGLDLGSTDNAKQFNVYKRAYAAGRVILGSNVDAPKGLGMYTVAVRATQAAPAPAPLPTAPTVRVGRYAAPTGTRTNDGTATRPWDLATALASPAALRAGDTLWVRGGTYRGCFTSSLTGTASAPIVVRQYPGERAILDNAACNDPALTANGAYTYFWGFEVTNSSPRKDGPLGINAFGDYLKFINLVVHDASGSGIGFWAPADGGEVYGTILYNNGRAFNLDHGIYTQNAVGTKRIADNVILNSWAYGLHVYGSDNAALRGYDIVGNAIFNSGAIGENGHAPNILVGGGTPAERIKVADNMLYLPVASSGNMWLGYEVTNRDVTVTGNYVAGGAAALRLWRWTTATVSNNTFYGAGEMANVQPSAAGVAFSGNTFYRDAAARAWVLGTSYMSFPSWQGTGLGRADAVAGTRPTGVRTFVRPNAYERGRANVVVYNWDRRSTVAVDLSSVLRVGDAFEVRTVQNLAAAPLVRATYGGGAVTLPMTSTAVAAPIGGSARAPQPTGPEFQVFLVTLQ